jgi:hypothetical protein
MERKRLKREHLELLQAYQASLCQWQGSRSNNQWQVDRQQWVRLP